jgi:hypothetical protein
MQSEEFRDLGDGHLNTRALHDRAIDPVSGAICQDGGKLLFSLHYLISLAHHT